MKGLRSVLIFGVDVKTPKDEVGSSAMLESGPCIQAIKLLKSHLPQDRFQIDVPSFIIRLDGGTKGLF